MRPRQTLTSPTGPRTAQHRPARMTSEGNSTLTGRAASRRRREAGDARTRRRPGLRLAAVALALLAGFQMVETAAAQPFNGRVCRAGLALGHAAGRLAYVEVWGDPNQYDLAQTNIDDAAAEIGAAESQLSILFDSRGHREAVRLVIDDLNQFDPRGHSPRDASNRIKMIADRYRRILSATYDSSRADARRWESSCATHMLRACYSYGRATVAAAAGEHGLSDKRSSLSGMGQAIENGLRISFDNPVRGDDGRSKQCCAFGPSGGWATIRDMSPSDSHAVFASKEGLLLATADQAELADGCTPKRRNFCATVSSKKGWQEINVPAGLRTISQITGSWNVHHAHRKAGPEGYKGSLEKRMHEEYKQYKHVKTVPFAALLMKAGSSSGIVWVQQTPHAFSGQRLLFRINDTDDALSDNSGVLEVCFGQ